MPHSSVDEQVVKMSFDNSNFDSNINDSIKALNSLDNKLGLLNKNNFTNLTNNVDNLAKVFTVKGQVMLGVLTSLGNKIVNLGSQAFRKLTQGIRDGLGEYNQIIESTQTIYQNVKQNGNSIDDVNNALDELNDYADKTIYNFGQMTRMIGMFTSAGVGLKKSVSTIKGLANAAALVGATPERAMIGWQAVSRAMSSGTFTNVTWRSLELSGIAGKQFNQVIKEVARANKVMGKGGKNIDQMIKKYGTLRETLREKWLTKDLFNEAMQIMSNEIDAAELKKRGYTDRQIEELRKIAYAAEEAATQVKTFKQLMETTAEAIGSGWAQSFRILIGDLEVAKKLYTRISMVISDFIDNNANIRNELFKQIVDGKDEGILKDWSTGRDKLKQIIENMLAIIKTFFKSVTTGFLNIFPVERISAAVRKVLDIVQNFTRALVLNKEQINEDGFIAWDTENIDKISDSVKDLIKFFRGLASAVDIAWMAISQPIKAIVERIPFFQNFFDNTNKGVVGLVKKLGQFGDKITVFRNAVKDTQIFGKILGLVIDNIDELGKEFPVLGAILWVFKGLKNAITRVKDAFRSLNIKPLSALFGAFKMIVTSIWTVLNSLFNLLKTAKNRINWSWLDGPKKAVLNFLKSLSDYGSGLKSFEQITGKIGQTLSKILNRIKTVFNNIGSKNKLVKATGEVTKYYNNLNTTVNKTGIKINDVWNKIKGLFGSIGDFFKNLKDKSKFNLDDIAKKIGLIGGGVAAASLSIAGLVKTIKKIKIIDNINDLLASGIDVIKAYQKEAQSKMILNIAAAIGILAASLAVLAFIPYENLENGLVVFTSFMSVLSITLTPILTAVARLNESLGSLRKQLTGYDVLNNFIKQLGKFGKQISKGINSRLIGKSFKDIAISILILVGAISALIILFKLDGDTTKRAIKNVINLIFALAAAVGVLGLTMGIVSRIMASSKTSATAIFSTFFTMSGVSSIILAIAAAMAVLVAALSKLATINTKNLEANFKYFRELLLWVSGISLVLTGVMALTKLIGDNSKVTGVVPILLAIAATVGVISLSIEKLSSADPKNVRKVFNHIIELTKTIGGFAALLGLIAAITKVFGSEENKTFAVITSIVVSLVALSGAMYILGESKPIDESIIKTIKVLTVALGLIVALLSVITIVIGRTKTVFSTNFATVFNKVMVGIAVVIASIGALTAGIALLMHSLSTDFITNADTNRAANNIVIKLSIIASTIRKAIPKLMEVFYSIGQYAGMLFTSFNMGLVDNIAATGDTYNQVAVKVVNLILDILGKVINTLHSRKEDIRRIIKQAIDLIGAIITEVINDVFKKNSAMPWKEEDVLRLLGFTGLTVGGGAIFLKIASNFNIIANSAKHLKGVFESVGNYFKPMIKNVQGAIYGFKTGAVSTCKLAVQMITDLVASVMAFTAALVLIKVGMQSLLHGIRQMTGEEAKYIRSDVTDIWSAVRAFIEDADFRTQALVDTFEGIGEFLVNVFMTIVNVIRIIHSPIMAIFGIIAMAITYIISLFNYIIGKKEEAFKIQEIAENIHKSVKNELWGSIDNIKNDWTHWGVFNNDGKVIDGAKKTASDIKTGGEIVSNAAYDASYNAAQNQVYGFMNGFGSFSSAALGKMSSAARKAIEANMRELGLGDYSGEILKNFSITNKDGKETTVDINKDYLDIIVQEKEKLAELNREEQINYVIEQARARGLKVNLTEVGQTMAAVLAQQQDQTKMTMDGIDALYGKTTATITTTLGDEAAATNMFVQDQMNSMALMSEIAEENSDKIVGKKKEEAIEVLKQEAMKRGLTEEAAREAAENLIATDSATSKTLSVISADELKTKVDKFKDEYEAFEAMEKAKTAMAAASKEEREKLAANEYTRVLEAMSTGKMDSATYRDWMSRNSKTVKEYNELVAKIKEIEQPYKDAMKNAESNIKNRWANVGMSADEINKKWQQSVNEYKDLAADAKTSQKPVWQTIKQSLQDFVNKAFNGTAGDIDDKTWKWPKTKNTTTVTDNDTTKAINAAKDLKNGLEAQRADLTPTFDLDKLASDANKANGIVMSSLMAAQNASIGDYINKDSELNPFMKDRWQNVYNFTQNNYSPKALSRIDIYRQTQRQISMSRGF